MANLAKNTDNKVEKKPKCSDINLKNWRDYEYLETGTLWNFSKRDKTNGHKYDYHGNFIPQIASQLYTRYTKKNDIILDLFLGSGTSAIEAANMERKCIGVELKADMVKYVSEKFTESQLKNHIKVLKGDSTSVEIREKIEKAIHSVSTGKEDKAQFVVLHPPYADIIKFSDKKEDLSNADSTEEFIRMFGKAAKTAYDYLEDGRYAALVIGDKYKDSELIPLSFLCMQKMNKIGFKTKSVIVKNIEGNEQGKGKDANLWRYRALAGGFYIFKHEYVIVFQKKEKVR
jgi:16S rRNA G966 N2-methylase RsmD